jgi:hypothetical protein
MAKGRRLDFDWITVSYRSIWIAVGIVALLLGGAAYVSFIGSRSAVEGKLRNLQFKLEDLGGRVEGNKALLAKFEEASKKHAEAMHFVGVKDFTRAGTLADEIQNTVTDIESELDRMESGYTAQIISVEGRVSVKRAGDFRWLDVRPGTQLKEGDKIRAGTQSSAEIAFLNGDRQTLMPNSLIEIYESRIDPVTSAERLSLRVSGGETGLISAPKRQEGSYTMLLTDSATVQLNPKEETEVYVDASREDQSSFKIISGSASLKDDLRGKTQEIGPQKVGTVSKTGGMTIRDLPPAPRLLEPQHGEPVLITNPKSQVVTLRWEIDSRASFYHLQISDSRLFTKHLIDNKEVRPDRKGVQLRNLAKGTYYWRVSLLDAGGAESPFSETRNFRIATEEISSGAQPTLELEEPLPIGRFLMVKGKSDPGVYLTINGQKADVRDDGSFEQVVRLDVLGENQIKVVAQNSTGGRTEKTYTHVFTQ